MRPIVIVTLTALVCASTHGAASNGATSYIDQNVYNDLLIGSRSILFISTIHTAPSQHRLSPKHEKTSRLIIIVDKPKKATKGKVKSSSAIPNYVYYNLSLSTFQASSLSMRVLLHGGRLLSDVAPLLYNQLLTKTDGSYKPRFFLLTNRTRKHEVQHTLILYDADQYRQNIFRYDLDHRFQPNVTNFQLYSKHLSVFSSPSEMAIIYGKDHRLISTNRHVLFQKRMVTYANGVSYALIPDPHSKSSIFYGCTIGKSVIVVTTDRQSSVSQCEAAEKAQPVHFTAGFIGEHRVYIFTPDSQVLSFAKSALYQNDASSVSRFDLETIPLGDFVLFNATSMHSMMATTGKTSRLFFWLALFLPASITLILFLLYYFLQPPRREPIQPGSLLRTTNVVVSEVVRKGLEEEARAKAAGIEVNAGPGHWLPPLPTSSMPPQQVMLPPQPPPPPPPQHWSPNKDHGQRPFPVSKAPQTPKVSDPVVVPTFSDASDWRPKVLVGGSLNAPAMQALPQGKVKSPNTSLATDAVAASKGKLFNKGRKVSKQSIQGAGASGGKPAVSPSKAKTIATRAAGKKAKTRNRSRR